MRQILQHPASLERQDHLQVQTVACGHVSCQNQPLAKLHHQFPLVGPALAARGTD